MIFKVLLSAILMLVVRSEIYIEQVLDCVQFDCAPYREICGIDLDCRKSYYEFQKCIAEQREATYSKCKTNGYMAWENVMLCYIQCQYFDLSAYFLLLTYFYFIIML